MYNTDIDRRWARSQYVRVDSCTCKLIDVASAATQGNVSGLQLFLVLFHLLLFLHSGKQSLWNADDCTLVAAVPSPGERVAVTESLSSGLHRISMMK